MIFVFAFSLIFVNTKRFRFMIFDKKILFLN